MRDVLAGAVLLLVGAQTHRLLPVFAIGVFIGFTVSQTGLVRHWLQERGRGWVGKAALNRTGAVLTAVAGMVLFASKFTEGAWLLLIVPGLMLLFDRIERYYYHVAEQLDLGRLPPKPVPTPSGEAMVIVPVVTINKVVGRALQFAMRLGGEVVPVAVDTDRAATRRLCKLWKQWDPGVDLRVLPSPHRTLVAPTVGFVRTQVERGASSSSCSPTSNRGADATEFCTTNAARCSPPQFAHAPTPSSPRFRFAWTEHLRPTRRGGFPLVGKAGRHPQGAPAR